MDRVLSVLPENIVLFNAMSPSQFCAVLNDRFPLSLVKRLSKFLEIDFSKYDKSQDLTTLLLEMFLLEHFGISQQVIYLWYYMHRFTYIFDRNNSFAAVVEYQRKSGDAGTWRLNTLVQLAYLVTAFDFTNGLEFFMVLSGDDSVVFLREYPHDLNVNLNLLSTRYNLEAKVLDYRTPYFCSKFLIITADGWLFVPDTVKLIGKLGRRDLVDYNHVEEYRISFNDNLAFYRDSRNWTYISECINDRYNLTGEHCCVYSTLLTVASDTRKFKELYTLKRDHVFGAFNTRPKLEI
nr:putative RdRp [Entomophthora virgavirus B]